MFHTCRTIFALPILLASAAFPLLSQQEDLTQLSLAELMEVKITVPTGPGEPLSLNETPGIVSVISRGDLVRFGARDLIDALRFVPGMEFGSEVWGEVGLGMRGIWALEGKILVLLDGVPLNSILFGDMQIGPLFPVEYIDRIEIIRGPGSALYGGTAELGVVNIISRNDSPRRTGRASASIGGGTSFDRASASVALGDTIGSALVSGWAGYSRSLRTDRTQVLNGIAFPMQDFSRMTSYAASCRISLEPLQFSILYLDNGFQSPDVAAYDDEVLANPFRPVDPAKATEAHWRQFSFDARASLGRVGPLDFTLHGRYLWQSVWELTGTYAEAQDVVFKKPATRLSADILAAWRPLRTIDVIFGIEGDIDRAHVADEAAAAGVTFYGDPSKREVSYSAGAIFSHIVAQTRIGNLAAGVRYDAHSQSGGAFAPRIALTNAWGALHAKLLASGAFRMPTIENFRNPDIKPERTRVYEAEVGYQVLANVTVVANAFDLTIDDPVVFANLDPNLEGSFHNLGRMNSRGIETEMRIRGEDWRLHGTYSYAAIRENGVLSYRIPGRPSQMLGFPLHKTTLRGSVRLASWLSLAPSVAWIGERFSKLSNSGDTVLTVRRNAPVLLADLSALVQSDAIPGLTASLSAFNVFDGDYNYIGPYATANELIPGPSREFVLKFLYRF